MLARVAKDELMATPSFEVSQRKTFLVIFVELYPLKKKKSNNRVQTSLLHVVATGVENPVTVQQFEFLRLPVEIRLRIYKLLIPNKPLVLYVPQLPKIRCRARYDGGSCYPAMLRTNRLIYRELSHEWYFNVAYHAMICHGALGFLCQIHLSCDALPSTLCLVKSLVLGITLSEFTKDTDIGLLQACARLLNSNDRNLQRLELQFLISPVLLTGYMAIEGGIAKFAENLSEYLQPLWIVQGLVAVSLNNISIFDTLSYGRNLISERIHEGIAILRVELEQFCEVAIREMTASGGEKKREGSKGGKQITC